MANKRIQLVLTQITATSGQLYGLDKNGRAWKYKPADHPKKAFWSQLTAYASKWISDKEKEPLEIQIQTTIKEEVWAPEDSYLVINLQNVQVWKKDGWKVGDKARIEMTITKINSR